MQPPGISEGSLSEQEAQIHHFLLFFLEPPGDCKTARGDQEAGRQGRGLPGNHPAPASQAAAAEGPGKPGRAFQLGQCKHDSNFTSYLTCTVPTRAPGEFSDMSGGAIPLRALDGPREQLRPAPPPPPARPGEHKLLQRERGGFPRATAGQ